MCEREIVSDVCVCERERESVDDEKKVELGNERGGK